MLPVYSPKSHSLYQNFLISNFLLYYPDPFSISRQTWKIIVQFWHLDLSQTTNILLDSYSKFGPAPRDPVSMLRSYLLSIKLKITSITDWVSRLKECPLYAIIRGESTDDCQASVPFTISSGISGTLNRNIFLSSSDIKRRKPQKGKNMGKNSQYQEYFCGTVSGFLQKASSSRPFLQSPFPDLPFIQAAVPGCFCIAWTHPAFCHLPCR